ncbi:MAG: 2-C-methyl-D-erythritol 2,4-cyclodiphosphate synthase [Salibacteraceae bacterium]
MNIRVGFGYDIHQLVEGRKCCLAGVLFDSDLGPVGHSDADVLSHAICDALLGAAGLRDIGHHFPNTDPSFKDADSIHLIELVVAQLNQKGYTIGNIDATLVAEVPRINPRVDEMKANIARACRIDVSDVAIKATTAEKLGPIGSKEGIEAYAVCLVSKNH